MIVIALLLFTLVILFFIRSPFFISFLFCCVCPFTIDVFVYFVIFRFPLLCFSLFIWLFLVCVCVSCCLPFFIYPYRSFILSSVRSSCVLLCLQPVCRSFVCDSCMHVCSYVFVNILNQLCRCVFLFSSFLSFFRYCAAHYVLCSVYYVLCSVQCVVCIMHCAFCIAYYVICSMHYAIYSFYCVLCIMYAV